MTAIRTADFNYPLPRRLIAQTPIEPRDHSRLLVLDRAAERITHRRSFFELTEYLQPGDLLVFNDSRVIPARLQGYRADTGGAIELLLLQRLGADTWRCLGKPGRRLRPGAHLVLEGNGTTLEVQVVGSEEGGVRVVHVEDERALEKVGSVPLPPYIRQPLREPERYQTVYARVAGSAAAPTAGLHFTRELLQHLRAKEVELAFVTLHIGAFTFRPVRLEDPRLHALDREFYDLSSEAAQAINRVKAQGHRVVCVGTTSVRLLESAALMNVSTEGTSAAVLPPQGATGWTELMILPGHRFRVADALVTNFHLPRSTLLMLVSAFAGRELVLGAYQEAVQEGYRFYSFGDSMLIL